MSKIITTETFEFGVIQAMIAEIKLRVEVLKSSKNIGYGNKAWIERTFLNRLNAMERDMIMSLPAKEAQKMKGDIMSTDTALQLNEFRNMFLSMGKSDRDKVEDFMISLKNTTI